MKAAKAKANEDKTKQSKDKTHYRHCGLDPQSRIGRLKGQYWMPNQVRQDGKEVEFE